MGQPVELAGLPSQAHSHDGPQDQPVQLAGSVLAQAHHMRMLFDLFCVGMWSACIMLHQHMRVCCAQLQQGRAVLLPAGNMYHTSWALV